MNISDWRALRDMSISVIRMWKKMTTVELQDTYRTKPVFGSRYEVGIFLKNMFVQSLLSIKMLVKDSIAAT
jgi:hypothetical protein